MIQLDAETLNTLIGWGAAPLLLVALVSHLKRFLVALPWTREQAAPESSPWAPLVLDALAIGYVKLMAIDGRLALEGTVGWPTIALVGIALGVITGKAYDVWTSRAA